MRCGNCGYSLEGTVCPKCGVDAFLFNKTYYNSVKYYNSALEKAQNDDIFSAIEDLEKSLYYDKTNIESRNLLGVLYCTVGQIPDGLVQFIISTSQKKSDNIAIKYINDFQKNPRELEKINDSIAMYNTSLSYIEQGNNDLAIIQLKKAIDYNPNFVLALNLLALMYLRNKQYSLCSSCLNKVFAIDKRNYTANKYNKALISMKSKVVIKSKRKESLSKKEITQKKEKEYISSPSKFIGKTQVISFFIGIFAATLVLMSLVIPEWLNQKNQEIEKLKTELVSEANAGSLDETVLKLQEENKRLQAELSKYSAYGETTDVNTLLSESEKLLNENKLESAANMLYSIDISSLNDETYNKYVELKEVIYPKAAQTCFDEGRSLYLNNNYTDALTKLENAVKFSSGEVFTAEALYYMGLISESNGLKDNANNYFQKIISEYPNSPFAQKAKDEISS